MRGGFLTVLEGEEAKIKVLAGPVSGEDTSPGSWVAVCGLRPHGVEVGRELPGVSFIRHESHHGLCTSQGPLLIHHTGCEDLTCQFGGGAVQKQFTALGSLYLVWQPSLRPQAMSVSLFDPRGSESKLPKVTRPRG